MTMFTPDYPGAIVVPAHETNYYRPEDHGNVPNKPRGWVLHTPEEDADNVESTPTYFQGANRQASTIYYLDNDGDVYQLVPERCAAIANGVIGKPYPAWADRNTSLNWQTLNVEIEGRGHTIHQTMPVGGVQFNSLVRLLKHRAAVYGFPCDREHVIGHYQVSNQRSDPGALFPWDALMAALNTPERNFAWGSERNGLELRGETQQVTWIGGVPVYSIGDPEGVGLGRIAKNMGPQVPGGPDVWEWLRRGRAHEGGWRDATWNATEGD